MDKSASTFVHYVLFPINDAFYQKFILHSYEHDTRNSEIHSSGFWANGIYLKPISREGEFDVKKILF